MEQYPASLGGKRRAAYLHRLAREFPHLARQRLVMHLGGNLPFPKFVVFAGSAFHVNYLHLIRGRMASAVFLMVLNFLWY